MSTLHEIIRRALRPGVALHVVISLTLCAAALGEEAFAPKKSPKGKVPAPYAFNVGAFSCAVLYDRTAGYPAAAILSNAPAAEVAAALEKRGLQTTKISTPYEGLLVRTGKNTVLIDTGAGPSKDPTKGRLLDSLAKAGVSPEQIDTVILTHGHLDHIGGTMTADGKPAFPNAKYVVARAEWEFWDSAHPKLESLPVDTKEWLEIAKNKLLILRDRIELIDHDGEIRPGISAILTPGHTPGHLVVQVESNGERLLYISDLVLSPVALEHPAWHPIYDLDRTAADAQVKRIATLAATEHLLVHAMHFPYPGLGHITAEGDHWAWLPLAAAGATD